MKLIVLLVLAVAGPGAEALSLTERVCDVQTLEFVGNTAFTSENLRKALADDGEVRRTLRPPVDAGRFRQVIAEQVIAGYQHAGYAEVTGTCRVSGPGSDLHLVVEVNEGRRWIWGQVQVKAPEDLREFVLQAVTCRRDQQTGLPAPVPQVDQKTAKPLVVEGKPAPCDPGWIRHCTRTVNQALGQRTGQEFLVQAQILRGDDGRADLVVEVRLPTRPTRLTAIEIEGLTPERTELVRGWLQRDLGITVGMTLPYDLQKTVTDWCRRSGRFVEQAVSLRRRADCEADLRVVVADDPDLPPFERELTAGEKLLIQLAEDAPALASTQAMQLTVSGSQPYPRGEFLMIPGRCMVIHIAWDADVWFDLMVDETAVLAASSTQARWIQVPWKEGWSLRLPIHVTTRKRLAGDDKPAGEFRFSLGFGNGEPGSAPVVVDVAIAPAFFLTQLHPHDGLKEVEDRQELGLGKQGRMSFQGGRLSSFSLPAEGEAGVGFDVRMIEDPAPILAALRTRCARLREATETEAPVTAMLVLSMRDLQQGATDPESSKMIDLVRGIIAVVGRPLEVMKARSAADPDSGPVFEIPSSRFDTPAELSQQMANMLGAGVDAAMRDVWPAGSWPTVLVGETIRVLMGDASGLASALVRLQRPGAMGPLGSLAAGHLLHPVHPPAARALIGTCLERGLDAEAAWRDVLLLGGGPGRLATFLDDITEVDEASLLVPAERRAQVAALLRSFQATRGQEGREEALHRLWLLAWEAGLRQEVEAGLRTLLTAPPPTVEQTP